MLNKEEINDLANNGMVENFNYENLNSSSYDVTVGDEYRFSHEENIRELNRFKKYIKIPEYSLCYILTKEKLKLPNNISACIHPRNKHVKDGLLMYPQPPIDPGYNGKLYILLHNLSNQERILERGECIASLSFYKMSRDSNPYDGIYQNATTLHDLYLTVDRGFEPFNSALSDIEEKFTSWRESLIQKYLPIMLVIITIIIGVLTIYFTINNVPWDKIYQAIKSIKL